VGVLNVVLTIGGLFAWAGTGASIFLVYAGSALAGVLIAYISAKSYKQTAKEGLALIMASWLLVSPVLVPGMALALYLVFAFIPPDPLRLLLAIAAIPLIPGAELAGFYLTRRLFSADQAEAPDRGSPAKFVEWGGRCPPFFSKRSTSTAGSCPSAAACSSPASSMRTRSC
jgi:hypothetical protein